MATHHLSTATHRISFVDEGDQAAEAVLLLHSLGADHRMWAEQQRHLLKRGYRVITPDSRGHGDSGWSTLTAAGEWGDELLLLLQELQLQTVHVWGISMGCVQALELLERPGLEVTSLVLSGAIGGVSEDVASAKVQALTDGPRTQGMRRWSESYADATLLSADQTLREVLTSAISRVDEEAYVQSARCCFQRRPGALARTSVPTLIIWGTRDEKTPRSMSERIAAELGSAVIEELPGAGHLANLDAAEAFSAKALSFLDRAAR